MRKPLLAALIVASVILVSLGVILLSRDTPAEPQAAVPTPLPNAAVTRISVQDLNTQLQGANPPLVWEFVSAEQYAEGHVPGSTLMAFDGITAATRTLDKGQAIVTMCTWPDEATSARAASMIQALGFANVTALEGGYNAWVAAGLPLETGQ